MDHKQLVANLKSDRLEVEKEWEFVNRYILPQRGPLYGTDISWYYKNNRSYSDGAALYNRTLASTVYGGIFTKKFFDTRIIGDKDLSDDVKLFLNKVTDSMHDDLFKSTSKFSTTIFEVMQDITGFGNGVMYLVEDDKKEKVFSHIGVNEIYFSKNIHGEPDIVCREFEMRGMDIISEFDQVSKELERSIASDPTKKVQVLHLVMKNTKKKGKPFNSYYYEADTFHLLHEGGFYSNPYIIGAWGHNPNSNYSYGPGIAAKQEVLMFQQIRKLIIQHSQLKVSPITLLANDSAINTLNLKPGGVNYGLNTRGEQLIQQLSVTGTLQELLELRNDTNNAIQQAFFMDSLIHRTGAQIRSAQEVIQRQEEQVRLMGPHISNVYSELVNPLLERLFEMKLRNKEFGEVPEELGGAEIKFVFTSPLAKAYELDLPNAILRSLEVINPLLQANPQSLDNFKIDDTIREVSAAFGYPERLLTPTQLRDENRQAQLEQQQQMQEMQQLQEIAGTAANLQKSGIPVVEGEE